MTSQTRSVLVYDGDCGFCTTSARWVESKLLPAGGTIAPWQSLELQMFGLSEADVTSASWWVDPQGGTHRGERGIAQMLVDRGGMWALLGRIALTPPLIGVLGLLYGLIAKNRYRLPGATDACRLTA